MRKLNVITTLLSFLIVSQFGFTQTVLNPGDFAIVGLNGNNYDGSGTCGTSATEDQISFICFKDIVPGTEIVLTDNGYERENEDLFGNSEGTFRAVRNPAADTIFAGTVITFGCLNSSCWATIPDADWTFTSLNETRWLNMSTSGDQIYFMQSDSTWTNPYPGYGSHDSDLPGKRMLFAFSTQSASGGWEKFGGNSNKGNIEPEWECFSMVSSGADYIKYTGLTSAATKSDWIDRIRNDGNWTNYSNCSQYNTTGPDYNSPYTFDILTGGFEPDAGSDTSVCAGDGAFDQNGAPAGGEWSGTGITNTSTGTFDPAVSGTGTFEVTYTAQSPTGCYYTDTREITVAAGAAATINIATNPPGAVCNGDTVEFTANYTGGGSDPAFEWLINSHNTGLDTSIITIDTLTAASTIICTMIPNSSCSAGPVSDTISVSISPSLTPLLSLLCNPSDAVCQGETIYFNAESQNAGANPVYEWKINQTTQQTGSDSLWNNSSFSDGDTVFCRVTADACNNNTDADTIIISVEPLQTVNVSIDPPNMPACSGDTLTFTALPVSEGSSPAYQWTKNGSNTGTNSPVFTSSTLDDNDTIGCILTSSLSCTANNPAVSGSVITDITGSVTAAINISANPEPPVEEGQSIVFTANPTNQGTSPVYQWQINGQNVGSNSITYTGSSLSDGDVIRCILQTSLSCAINNPDTSNLIAIEFSKPGLIIYNTFSPNADGVNETWEITNIEQRSNHTVRVFSRNGMLVFESTDYEKEKFEGKNGFSGNELPASVYYYLIETDNGEVKYKGQVMIVR